jgi:hypothetical protein
VFSPGNGSIYALQTDGSLLWYRHNTVANPNSYFGAVRDQWVGPVTVATGLTDDRSLFSMMPRDVDSVVR